MPEIVRRKADFSELRLFWAVAEARSFGAAARALGVSPSTLTRAVDNLEARLEVKLLVRSAQGVSLTPAGKAAYERVLTMERSAAALELELAGQDKSASGVVKVSAPDGVGGVLITPWMPDFLRAHPDIDLVFDCGLWANHPLEGEVDVALTFTRPDQAEVVARPIAWFHYGLFAAQGHLDLYGRPGSVQESLTHAYIHHTAHAHQLNQRAEAFITMVEPRLTTNSSAVSLSAICEGAGIGGLPTCILAVRPELVMLHHFPMAPVAMWLVQRQETSRSARVNKVISWLEDVFDQSTQPWYREEYVPPSQFQTELARYLARRRGERLEAAMPGVREIA